MQREKIILHLQVCINLSVFVLPFFMVSCLSTHDRIFASVEQIEKSKIIGVVNIQFRIYDDYETFESIKGLVYRKLLAEAQTKYKHMDIEIENILIEGSYSFLNILTLPINGYITPFIMKINAKGFVVLKE